MFKTVPSSTTSLKRLLSGMIRSTQRLKKIDNGGNSMTLLRELMALRKTIMCLLMTQMSPMLQRI
jgi:hypothetical protein